MIWLAALAAAVTPTSDGYQFERATRHASEVIVTVVRFQSVAELDAYLHFTPAGPDKELLGYTVWDGPRCTIYIVDERVSYRPEILGHEMTHCLAGDFHPHQPK